MTRRPRICLMPQLGFTVIQMGSISQKKGTLGEGGFVLISSIFHLSLYHPGHTGSVCLFLFLYPRSIGMMDRCIHKGEGASSAIDEGNEGGAKEHIENQEGEWQNEVGDGVTLHLQLGLLGCLILFSLKIYSGFNSVNWRPFMKKWYAFALAFSFHFIHHLAFCQTTVSIHISSN